MSKYRTWSLVLLVVMVLLGWFLYASQTKKTGYVSHFPFKLGLDLAGGTELTYKADTTQVTSGDIQGAMDSLKDVIERRVNLFGVSEPVVQVEGSNAFSKDNKLIVDLPGVTDVKQAIAQIGQTPTLDFRIMDQNASTTVSSTTPQNIAELFKPTGLTGRYLAKATLEFNNQAGATPVVSLQFNPQGSDLFAKLTKENIGKVLASIS